MKGFSLLRLCALAALVAVGCLLLAAAAVPATSPLDLSFGTGGKVVLADPGSRIATVGGAVQSDGKPILVGQIRPESGSASENDLYIARLNTNGTLDTSFGSGGSVTTDVHGGADVAETVAVAPDDSLIVGGTGRIGSGDAPFVIGRYSKDGVLDTSFGTNGFYTGHVFSGTVDEQITSILIQPDGKIVAVDANLNGAGGFAVIRLNADGTLDTSFGNYGVAEHDGDASTLGYSLARLPDGALIVGGAEDGSMAAWKFGTGSTLDGSWANNSGTAYGAAPATGTGDISYGMVVQPDGKIVLAGGRGFSNSSSSNEAFALERLNADGTLDTSFGKGGVVTLQVGGHDDEIESLQQLPDGRLMAVGLTATTESATTYATQLAAARFTAQGALDTQFAGTGRFVVATGLSSFANASAMLADGKVVAFGLRQDSTGVAGEAVRFLPTAPYITFGPTSGVVGDTVVLTGSGFGSQSRVTIGGFPVPDNDVDVVSAGEIDVIVPSGAVTGKIGVTTAGVSVLSKAVYGVRPTITGLASTAAVAAGQSIGITGETFTGTKSVKVGGVAWKFKIDSPTHLTATAPVTLVSGDVVVANGGGSATGPSVSVVPTITSFSPLTAAAGAILTIHGSGLGGGEVFVGPSAQVVFSSGQTLRVRVPDCAGVGPIEVEQQGAPPASSTTVFKALPKIAVVSGGREGDTVSFSGTNLAGLNSVTLGGHLASFSEGTCLGFTAQIPDGVATGTWSVTTNGGSATSAVYAVRPALSSFSPAEAGADATVTVVGSTFAGVKSVTVGGVTARFTVVSPTQLNLVVPAGASTGPIAVTTAGGTATSATNFVVDPVITHFTPTSGKAGTVMTITGTDLGQVTSVVFDAGSGDAVSATPTKVTSTSLVVTVPADAHPGPIGVSGPGGSATSSVPFDVTLAVYGFSPQVALPGDTVTIDGAGLATTSSVSFNGIPVSPTSVTSTTVTAVLPAGTGNAQIALTLGSGTVNVPGQLTLIALYGSNNDSQSDTVMTLFGNGLEGVTQVDFTGASGFVASPSFVFHGGSGTHYLTVTIPSGARTGPIRVDDAQGESATTPASFEVMWVDELSEQTWSPGDTVTVTGSGLVNAWVRLNGELCPVSAGGNDGTLTFTVPADATSGHLVIGYYGRSFDAGEFDESAPAPISSERVAQGAI